MRVIGFSKKIGLILEKIIATTRIQQAATAIKLIAIKISEKGGLTRDNNGYENHPTQRRQRAIAATPPPVDF
jgi:hypothetical protein